MLAKKQIGILRNIIKHSERVEEKAIGISRSTFDSDLDIREIICFNIREHYWIRRSKDIRRIFIEEYCIMLAVSGK